jgi:topoisomerase-4 subunit A
MMNEFNLSDMQAEAILNMKLRSLRRLEEQQLRNEFEELALEKAGLENLLSDDQLRKTKLAEEIKQIQKDFGAKTVLGKRRTQIAGAIQEVEMSIETLIEKEPITVVLSKQGWIRALKGNTSVSDLKFKEGDSLAFSVNTYTTDHIMLFATNGRFYSILGNNITGGRGFGEPVRLSIDLPEDANIIEMFIFKPDQKLLVASESGKGFIVDSSNIIAQTRAGKIILNLGDKDTAYLCRPVEGDSVAVIGNNRKLLVFKTEEIPTMVRGSGVMLQRYNGAKLSDVKFFNWAQGLPYPSGNGIHIEPDMTLWLGKRAGVGHFPPVGFPRSNKFK